MTTFNWKIELLERQVETGGVTTAHWRVIAEDVGYTTEAYGSVNFTPDPSDSNFVPYESLTEQDVLSWVWAYIDRMEIESRLDAVILEKKQPVVLAGLPW